MRAVLTVIIVIYILESFHCNNRDQKFARACWAARLFITIVKTHNRVESNSPITKRKV